MYFVVFGVILRLTNLSYVGLPCLFEIPGGQALRAVRGPFFLLNLNPQISHYISIKTEIT